MQQQIIQSLIDSCTLIAPPTYQTAIGSTVHYRLAQDVEYSAQCVNIIDEVESTTISQLKGSQAEHRMLIEVVGVMPTTRDTALIDSCKIKADLFLAVRNAQRPLNCKLLVIGSDKDISGEGKLLAQVSLTLEAVYRCGVWEF